MVVDPIIYRVLYIPGGAGFLQSTVRSLGVVLVSFVFLDTLSQTREQQTDWCNSCHDRKETRLVNGRNQKCG